MPESRKILARAPLGGVPAGAWEPLARVAAAGLSELDEERLRSRLVEALARCWPDGEAEWAESALQEAVILEGGRAEMHVPLYSGGVALGGLTVTRVSPPWTEADLGLLAALAPAIAASLARARLYQRATTDPVSGLPVRARFSAELEDATAAAQASKRPLSLLLFEADHLKDKADVYGRGAVDRLLRELADLLAAHSPRSLRARWAGDVLAVALPGVETAALKDMAETLRRTAEGMTFDSNHEGLRCTLSAGAAILRPGDMASALFSRASDALEAARRGGGNRVELAR